MDGVSGTASNRLLGPEREKAGGPRCGGAGELRRSATLAEEDAVALS